MPEQQTMGEKPADAAGQQQAGEGKTADGQQITTPAAEGNQNEVEGLKAAAVAEREKRQTAEAETQAVRDQMAVMNANQPQPAAQQPQGSLYMQIATKLGYDTDYLTPEEQGHVMDSYLQIMASSQMDNSFMASHSDYEQVVGKIVNGVFVEAPPLKRYLDKAEKTNPGLRQALRSMSNNPSVKMVAYELAINNPEYQEELKKAGMTEEEVKAAEAEAKIKAANATASISSVPGGGNLDKAAQIRGMSDAEFQVHLQKIKDQAF